jgi:beta-lactamase class A
MKKILAKKIPLYFLFIATGLLLLIIYHLANNAPQAKLEIQQAIAPVVQSPDKIEQVRLKEYTLTSPLLTAEPLSESEDLKELKRSLNLEINQLKSDGIINEASVYVRSLNNGDWTSVNSDAQYAPGSVIKIAAFITYLKMSEQNPKLLSTEFIASANIMKVPVQTFKTEPMVAGKKYSAKELLTRMIVNSDNQATLIINESLDIKLFKKLFTDLGINEPDVHDPHFKMDVSDLSKFLNILYNATYLNKSNSEYALTLLAESSFSQGIVNGIPPEVRVAHKFGETGNKIEAQLHETAIVYIGNDPYLITIMTKGKNVQRLPEVLSELSKITYLRMKS